MPAARAAMDAAGTEPSAASPAPKKAARTKRQSRRAAQYASVVAAELEAAEEGAIPPRSLLSAFYAVRKHRVNEARGQDHATGQCFHTDQAHRGDDGSTTRLGTCV